MTASSLRTVILMTSGTAQWRRSTDGFEQALLKAVNLGDDSDTVGAVTGGLAGLYYGYDQIPASWLDAIKRREWIEGLCDMN